MFEQAKQCNSKVGNPADRLIVHAMKGLCFGGGFNDVQFFGRVNGEAILMRFKCV